MLVFAQLDGSLHILALFRIPFAANWEVPSHVFKQEEELEPQRSCSQPHSGGGT